MEQVCFADRSTNSEKKKIATSVTMPMIIVIPIIAVMLSSIPVSHRPMKTAQTARSGIKRIAKAMEKLS